MSNEVYQAFMVGYVRRINEATMNVQIGGIRIGSAKYSRLAQINLKTRIITFSRYAIENVPERGRRYLVIHELAHVKEPSHNSRFWEIVGRHEPNYKQIGRALELAFKRNVKEDQVQTSAVKLPNPLSGRLEMPKLLLNARVAGIQESGLQLDEYAMTQTDFNPLADENDCYECTEDEFGSWTSADHGIVHGGSELIVGAETLV
jgi:hypothetical protein